MASCKIDLIIKLQDKKLLYRIFRLNDGQPEAVISDLYIFTKNYFKKYILIPEYFLSNFIFYATLARWVEYIRSGKKEDKSWEHEYGVCTFNCSHPWDYSYTIDTDLNVKVEEIKQTFYGVMSWGLVFEGTLDEAYEKFCVNTKYANGCHITQYILDLHKVLSLM